MGVSGRDFLTRASKAREGRALASNEKAISESTVAPNALLHSQQREASRTRSPCGKNRTP